MTQDDTPSLSPQDALVTLMIAASVSDEKIRTAELVAIQTMVNHLPIFSDYDLDRFPKLSQLVFDLFEEEDGLDALFGLIRDSLPEKLYETGYGLACTVVAADGMLGEIELRFLQEIRYELNIPRLSAAAIDHGVRVLNYRT